MNRQMKRATAFESLYRAAILRSKKPSKVFLRSRIKIITATALLFAALHILPMQSMSSEEFMKETKPTCVAQIKAELKAGFSELSIGAGQLTNMHEAGGHWVNPILDKDKRETGYYTMSEYLVIQRTKKHAKFLDRSIKLIGVFNKNSREKIQEPPSDEICKANHLYFFDVSNFEENNI